VNHQAQGGDQPPVCASPNPVEAQMEAALAEHPDPKFWMKLVATVHEAHRIDGEDPENSAVPAELRSAQFLLHNLTALLLEQPYFQKRPELCSPLLRVSNALHDLGHGRAPPIFKPVQRKHHSPGQLSPEAIIKGHAARALSELIRGGMPKEDAAKKTAQALKGAAKKLRQKITPQTVENWRERFEQGPGPGSPDAALFAYNHKPGPPGDTPLDRGLNLLDELERYAAAML
jgi:hypothetical protein